MSDVKERQLADAGVAYRRQVPANLSVRSEFERRWSEHVRQVFRIMCASIGQGGSGRRDLYGMIPTRRQQQCAYGFAPKLVGLTRLAVG